MTLTLQSQDDFAKQLAEFDKIQDTCKKLLATKHYAALGEHGIHAIMARAKALGIHPFEALNGGFHCINGKVGMSTEMMAALVRQKGHSITKDPKSNAECCILHGKRADNGDSWTCSFGRADAEAAGLWNTATWKKYPQVMLYNRCMSMLFRQLFPDLSLGAGYVEDELKEITKTGDYSKVQSLPIAEAEFIDEPKKIEQKEEPKPEFETVSPAQAEELRLLRLAAPQEIRERIDNLMLEKGVGSFDKLPIKGYQYVKEQLSKVEEAVNE